MALKEYIEQIKQDINRSFKAPNVLTEDLDRTHFIRICIVFALNILGIIGFVILKEDFPVSVFVALWGISALIIIDVLWHIFSKEIAKNMPDLFAVEYKKRGKPAQEFKCYVNFIGHTHFRGFKCRVSIYDKAVVFKFAKYCLVIENAKHIKLSQSILGYRCEADENGKYVQCNMNKKQAEILQNWIDKNNQ